MFTSSLHLNGIRYSKLAKNILDMSIIFLSPDINMTVVSEMDLKYLKNVKLFYLKMNLVKNESDEYDSIIYRNSYMSYMQQVKIKSIVSQL